MGGYAQGQAVVVPEGSKQCGVREGMWSMGKAQVFLVM